MSELDRAVRELVAARSRKEAERHERHRVACAFLRDFYDQSLKSSQVLQDEGIEATFAENKVILHKPATGHFLDPFYIVVDENGAIDCAGRSFGRYTPEQRDEKTKELISEIIGHFDL